MPKAWDKQTIPPVPSAWIQWKGTDVCMDVKCACGNRFHVDDSFCYYVKCLECEAVYLCNGHIELVPMDDEDISGVNPDVIKVGDQEFE